MGKILDLTNAEIITEFHKIYYYATEQTLTNTFWMGVRAEKFPTDLWIYQEILFETRPTVIIETGTRYGGSSLFMASVCDLLNCGRVITIDIVDMAHCDTMRPLHERIHYITGSSVSEKVVDEVRKLVAGEERIMVVLDSDHSRTHVLEELNIYHEFVTQGSYLIVEDTNINGHPVLPDFGPGPMEALEVFLRTNRDFVSDRSREKLLLTCNPKGFLRKKTSSPLEAELLEAEEDTARLRAEVADLQRRLAEVQSITFLGHLKNFLIRSARRLRRACQ